MSTPAETIPQPAADAPTIVVEGRTYLIAVDPAGDVLDPGRPTYWLHGPRGALLFTIRNEQRPFRMFLVNGRGFTKAAPKTWLTDESGKLAVR